MKLNPRKSKQIFNTFDLIKLRRHDIIAYIKKLHGSLKRKNEIIKLLKIKLKALCKIDENQIERIEDKNGDDEDATAKTKEFIEEIKKTAIDIENSKRFAYEPTSGLYYDYATGYYYNSELGLFYDGQTACYYSYDQEANEYKLHSQCASKEQEEVKSKNEPQTREKNQRKSKSKRKHHHHHRRRRYSTSSSSSITRSSSTSDCSDDSHHRRRHHNKKRKKKSKKSRRGDSRRRRRTRSRGRQEKEDGEISSSAGSSVILIDDDDANNKHPDDLVYHQDMAKIYPPSLRLVVTETNLPKIKVGQLFMVTYKGGSLGREGDHDVTIPDINVSKHHLKFTYNEDKFIYQIVDLGSRNGTLINGNRMSNAKQESEPFDIVHGCELQLAQTKLLCHIHDGHATCDQCEPGILAVTANSDTSTIEKSKIGIPIAESYKSELKRIQKKYGLEGEKFVESNPSKNINDRAEKRRKEVGSTNPNEKTEIASVSHSIKPDNKGFKMLAKLGWSEGQSLGKNDTGIKEPIQVASNEGTAGLGSDLPSTTVKLNRSTVKKNLLWKKTQERFKKLDKCDMFHESDQEDY